MADEVKLLTFWSSPFALRAELALAVKGVKHEKVQQDLTNKSQLLLESNPIHKKIPVLIHNGKPLAESAIIVQYVDEAWPSRDGKDLLPQDPYERAVARFWADYVDNKLFNAIGRIVTTVAGEEQQKAIEDCMEALATLEGALGTVPKEPPFFGGASVGYVDIILAPIVVWYPGVEMGGGFKIPFEEKFPLLRSWIKAIEESCCGEFLPESSKVAEMVGAVELTTLTLYVNLAATTTFWWMVDRARVEILPKVCFKIRGTSIFYLS